MRNTLIILLMALGSLVHARSLDSIAVPPVRGLAITAPQRGHVDEFATFMKDVLAPGGINTLVLRVDYRYTYSSHPELRSENPLSEIEVKKLVQTAAELEIRLIPQINLLGHQSWSTSMGKLLLVYPEFDENPSVKLPETYKWPNEDGLYCKSYCPLHPEVHRVVFALVDELLEAFEADAFHAGMDEVFYLAEEECPRCAGKDRAALFAGEVNRIRDHLAGQGKELWIWGDRLLDGESTGLGMWEASENGTHPAIDMIHKDVLICDWHYERADPTPAYFAHKGFRVITCPWNRPVVCQGQLDMISHFRQNSPPVLRDRYHGFMQTIWSSAEGFIEEFYASDTDVSGDRNQAACFRTMLEYYQEK